MSKGITGTALCWLVFLSFSATGFAEPRFPDLTGRVVDNSNFLSANTEAKLSKQLEAHENATGNQVVVVTLNDLQGYSIEEFGYQLGRHWGIGQQGKDNGVLLLVARAERKVRIEVGYGLEGTLTDAISSNIIHSIITPAFKKRQYDLGISRGVTAIIDALGGKYTMKKTAKRDKNPYFWLIIFMAMIFWPLLSMIFPFSTGGRRYGRSYTNGYYGGGFGGGRYGGGGFGGGGFGGGGGGFGGGGASGGW